MLGRIRGATIALGLIATLPEALAQERVEPALESQPVPEPRQEPGAEQRQPRAGEQGADAEPLVPALNAIETAIRDLIAEDDAQQRERQEHHEIADLQAQKDMAFWAERMTWATYGSVALTFAGVLLIWRTLKHTRRTADAAIAAVEEGQRTADAAIEANRINRDMFIRDQRAWLSISNFKIIDDLVWNDGSVATTKIRHDVKNVRRSPALNVWRMSTFAAGWGTSGAMNSLN